MVTTLSKVEGIDISNPIKSVRDGRSCPSKVEGVAYPSLSKVIGLILTQVRGI